VLRRSSRKPPHPYVINPTEGVLFRVRHNFCEKTEARFLLQEGKNGVDLFNRQLVGPNLLLRLHVRMRLFQIGRICMQVFPPTAIPA
jgi:hypothetical protein